MIADATLTAILTGGVYTSAEVGHNGITQDSTPSAFDVNGNLKPTALVKNRELIPDGQVQDFIAQHTSANQVVEIWLYEERGYTNIDLAKARLYTLFQGYQFSTGFEVEWVNTVERQKDEGALAGASVERQDWFVSTIVGL